jgi:hypothetical protein
LASYRAATPPSERPGLKAEIQAFLQYSEAHGSDVGEDVISVFRPDVDPTAWDMSAREWLLRIHDLT